MGIFEIWQEERKNLVEKVAKQRSNPWQPRALIPYDVARCPIFTDRRREREEHEEPKGETHVDTRENRLGSQPQEGLTLGVPFPSPVGSTGPIESQRETVR